MQPGNTEERAQQAVRSEASPTRLDARKSVSAPAHTRNVGQAERVVSSIIGGALLVSALRRPTPGSVARMLAGGALLQRGLTGLCYLYRAIGRNTAEPTQQVQRRLDSAVQRTITIGKTADELYSAWRDPEHISAIMGHFARVDGQGEGRFRWTVSLPGQRELTWSTHTVDALPGELIAWRTEPDAPFEHVGSVGFRKAPGSLGTEVTLRMSFGGERGALHALTTKVLRKAPQLLEENILRRCKSLCETGEIPTLERNPAARQTASRAEQHTQRRLQPAAAQLQPRGVS